MPQNDDVVYISDEEVAIGLDMKQQLLLFNWYCQSHMQQTGMGSLIYRYNCEYMSSPDLHRHCVQLLL